MSRFRRLPSQAEYFDIAGIVREGWKRDADPEYAALADENERLRAEAAKMARRAELGPERERLAAENRRLREALDREA